MTSRALTSNDKTHGIRTLTCAGLANGDDSAVFSEPNRAGTISVQVTGTFGVGGSVQLDRSNDGTNFVLAGTPITAAGIQDITSYAHYHRLRVTAGDGTTNLTGTIILKRE